MPPDPAALRAFLDGRLPAAEAAALDAWLATAAPAEAEAALAAAGADEAAGASLELPAPAPAGFVGILPRSRLESGEVLGAGGMATVHAARDRVLDRSVAMKVLHARRADESLESYRLREAAFHREAAVTAALEHPAIPPVYDVGSVAGRPAFLMQRLHGRTLAEPDSLAGLALAERVALLLRVAEAVACAHASGLVHRDLTPANVLVGHYGAVHVLDWGLAERQGAHDGLRVGTPGWMAPEQAHVGQAVDARSDVFALGALLLPVLTGRGPRPAGASAETVVVGDLRRLPRPLAALLRRCLAVDPAQRYADAAAVVAELRAWFDTGMTAAEEIGVAGRLWRRLRRSRRAGAATVVVASALLAAGAVTWVAGRQSRRQAETRIAQLAATPLDRPDALVQAVDELRSLATVHGEMPAAVVLAERFQAAIELSQLQDRDAALRAAIARLLRRTRTHGPWADQVQDWRRALRDAGLQLDEAVEADAARLTAHRLREELQAALAFLWRAERERGAEHHAERSAALLAAGGTTPGWQALGRLLGVTQFAAHDPVFCRCADSEILLAETAPRAVALALFGPEERLATAAAAAVAEQPGDFWPLVALGRAHLAAGDGAQAERAALVAAGAEPDSVLPQLLLAYVALQRGDHAALSSAASAALARDAGNAEAQTLLAVARVRLGDRDGAQALVDG